MVRGIESFRSWFRGYEDQGSFPGLTGAIKKDMFSFVKGMATEAVDLKQLGIRSKTAAQIIQEIITFYRLGEDKGE